ncbi:MAG TPA: methylenetetrahydrofolate reductase [NAD(P)H] [Elusimicrobia bacterium]|nr:methylenetetrahydrofolate reductase [NAD(P)H] [Elusimicrobiota bacterium]
MRIPALFSRGEPVFSFEFFQPKNPEDLAAFQATVRKLKDLSPAFVTITYGAAGTAREGTFETAAWIKREAGIETAAHLTCISHTRSEIERIVESFRRLGIENVVALRGDHPKEGPLLPPERRELPYAADLVRFIRARGDFSIAVAGYPEKHPEAPSMEEDLRRLQEKVEAGAEWVITQLFFDNAHYLDFVARARALGVRVPIVPGIMPITSYAQTRKFTQMCGTAIPERILADLAPIAADREKVVAYGIDYAFRQCRELLDRGAPGIHFYTLNRSHSTTAILSRLRDSC